MVFATKMNTCFRATECALLVRDHAIAQGRNRRRRISATRSNLTNALKDQCGNFLWRATANFHIAINRKHAGDWCVIESEGHDAMSLDVEEDVAHLPPFEFAPLLPFVVGTVERYEEVGLLAIKRTEVEVQIRSREFGSQVIVVKDRVFAQGCYKGVGDLPNEIAFLAREGESNTKSFL